MKRLICILVAGLFTLIAPGLSGRVHADEESCPNFTNSRYAVVGVTEDSPITQADETIEVADEWLNGCGGAPPSQSFTSEVLWLLQSGSPTRWIEVGVRRKCNGDNVQVFPYHTTGVINANGSGSAFPARFKDGSGNDVDVDPATRVDVTIKDMGEIVGESSYHEWRTRISFGGNTFEAKDSMLSTFHPTMVRVGGENVTDLHDMGVTGHLATRYLLSTGSGLVLTFLSDRTVNAHQDAPRYNIRKGAGGFGGSNYFQVFSNIHVGNPSPTAVPENFVMCTGE